jgi:hypothetical protein
MWRRIKQQLRDFRRSSPGERFESHYRRSSQAEEKPTKLWRALSLVVAFLAFVLGVVFSLIPGIPGFVFFFLSAALLASESLRVARFLDWAELKLRQGWARITRRRRPRRPAAQGNS